MLLTDVKLRALMANNQSQEILVPPLSPSPGCTPTPISSPVHQTARIPDNPQVVQDGQKKPPQQPNFDCKQRTVSKTPTSAPTKGWTTLTEWVSVPYVKRDDVKYICLPALRTRLQKLYSLRFLHNVGHCKTAGDANEVEIKVFKKLLSGSGIGYLQQLTKREKFDLTDESSAVQHVKLLEKKVEAGAGSDPNYFRCGWVFARNKIAQRKILVLPFAFISNEIVLPYISELGRFRNTSLRKDIFESSQIHYLNSAFKIMQLPLRLKQGAAVTTVKMKYLQEQYTITEYHGSDEMPIRDFFKQKNQSRVDSEKVKSCEVRDSMPADAPLLVECDNNFTKMKAMPKRKAMDYTDQPSKKICVDELRQSSPSTEIRAAQTMIEDFTNKLKDNTHQSTQVAETNIVLKSPNSIPPYRKVFVKFEYDSYVDMLFCVNSEPFSYKETLVTPIDLVLKSKLLFDNITSLQTFIQILEQDVNIAVKKANSLQLDLMNKELKKLNENYATNGVVIEINKLRDSFSKIQEALKKRL